MEEPDLILVHGSFHPVRSHAARKTCPRGGVQVSPFPQKRVVFGFLESRWVPGFSMCSWIHDGFLDSRFLDSRWVLGFTIDFRAVPCRIIPCQVFTLRAKKNGPCRPCQVFRAVPCRKQLHAVAFLFGDWEAS